MTFASHRARFVLHLPLWLFLLLGAVGAGTVAQLVQKPGMGAAAMALFSMLLVGLALNSIRWLCAREGRVLVRGLFRRDTLAASSCVFGIEARRGSKGGVNYGVYATDGVRRVDVGDTFTQSGALRLVRRLAYCLDLAAPGQGTRQAEEDLAKWSAQDAAARAQVAVYYRSGAFRRAGRWIIVAVLLYIAVVLVYAWRTGTRL